jgi:hypothetical protein
VQPGGAPRIGHGSDSTPGTGISSLWLNCMTST